VDTAIAPGSSGRPARHLVLDDVHLHYPTRAGEGTLVALAGVRLAVDPGEFVALVGPSGCGKTSLLLLVNGLLRVTAGQVLVDGQPVQGPSRERALVFQEFALLPWRTVLANVELGLEVAGAPRTARRAAAREHLRLVGLEAFADAFPHQLSGGMRQRVGLARALAVQPRLLLMDEPFGALDAQTRQVLGAELLRIWEEDRRTVLFVTHDIDEAVFLADRVVVLSARPGRVLDDVRVPLGRPRPLAVRSAPEFGVCRERIWAALEDDVRRALLEPAPGSADGDGG
jgi:NitT/TauT family transport system ATP-binding protein